MTRHDQPTILAAAALLVSFGSACFAQPAEPPSRRPPARSAEAPPPGVESLDREELSAERLRSILERRLERAREQERRTEKAIELLDSGTSIDELRAEYRDLFFERDGRREADDEPRRGIDAAAPEGDEDAARDWRERRRERWSPEDHAKMLAFLAEEFPELHERVREVIPGGPEGPEEIDPRVERRMAPLVEMMRLKERDPEMFALRKELWSTDRAAWEAARKVREASEETRAQAAEELHAVLGRQFDLQLRQHQLELDRLEARLRNARRDAAQQATNRDNLINERLLEVLARQDERDDRGRDRRGPREESRQPAP